MSVVDSGSPSRQNAATDILFDRRLWGREEAFSGFLTLAKVKGWGLGRTAWKSAIFCVKGVAVR